MKNKDNFFTNETSVKWSLTGTASAKRILIKSNAYIPHY